MHFIRTDLMDFSTKNRCRKCAIANTMKFYYLSDWMRICYLYGWHIQFHWLVFQDFSTLFPIKNQNEYLFETRKLTPKPLNFIYRLMDFFPQKKQTEEYLKSVFIEKGLAEVVKLHKAQASYEAKRELTQVRNYHFNHLELGIAL